MFEPYKDQRVFDSAEKFRKHYRRFHIETKCDECGENFENYAKFKAHR